MPELGDYKEDATKLGHEWTCWDTSGIPTALAGTPVVTVKKISDGTTKTSAETYITLTEGVKSTIKIDLSGDAFFATGEDYSIYISTGTVDGGTVVNAVVATFSIENRNNKVDVTSISGDSTAADNLELQYDTTGLTGDNFPATQAQVGAIGAVPGGALPFAPDTDNVLADIKSISFVGVQTSGTFASTEAKDGVYHVIDDTTNAIDIVYGYSIGGNRTAVSVTLEGFLNSNNDSLNIQAYDFVGSDWETRAILSGQGSSLDITQVVALLSKHTGITGSDIGKVYIRFQNTGQTNPTLNMDELLVSAVQLGQSVGYANGRIYINTNASNTNTENFVDGVADNPVSTWAAALTLSGQLGLTDFHIVNGSTIQLSANSDHYSLFGDGWVLDLNGQSIVGIAVFGAKISGVAAGIGNTQTFHDCLLGACSHIKDSHFLLCGIEGTQTVVEAGDFFFDNCHSAVAGTATWIFDFGDAIGTTNLNIRNYSGGIQLESMGDTGTDAASIEGFGQIIEGTCTGGIVAVRGHFTRSGIINLTLSDDARYSADQLESKYADGRVWIDTVNGMAGTQDYENGTVNNPVDSIADALTIAASVGLNRFYVKSGSSFTLPSNVDAFNFMGCRYIVALGGQSVSGTQFHSAQVTGNDDGSNSLPTAYINCLMNDNTLGVHQMIDCGLGGDMTFAQAGMSDWVNCYSRVAGVATPSIDFGTAVGNTNFNMRHYSGGIEVKNMGQSGTDNMSLEGFGQLIVNANCTGGTIALRGHFGRTDNSGGAVEIVDDANFSHDSLILISTIIATLATQKTFTLTHGSTDDKAYKDHIIVVTDAATSVQKAVGKVSAYVGSTKGITLAFDPGIFTMAVGDKVDILSVKAVQAVWSRS